MLPVLYGNGKAQDGSFDFYAIDAFKEYCEEFDVASDGTWFLRADICMPDVIQLFDGELLDLLTDNFRSLMDLKFFHEGKFTLHVPLTRLTVSDICLCREVVGMCSALGIEIRVYIDDPAYPPA